ncbi:MAG: pyruvate carboxylase [Oscillospiraceae bacterium]|nr:pyruvate carboxylase [Oscillospiraceae bacterium]
MQFREIKKVLVANRGEIAVRVIRACHDMGLSTIAIYSKEDKNCLFRTTAGESYMIGKDQSPLGAYLDIEQIVRLAVEKGADAIHPGYGFLAENADLARACREAGIVFIGPPEGVLDKMGDKLSAKEIAKSCGVPVIEGVRRPLESVDDGLQQAERIGYPVILKAAAGGGGRGMRLVQNPAELAEQLPLVQSEALKAFGSDDIFIEKFIVQPKHIEIQVLADHFGNVVHLYERDCSLQRRYQKVVEYTPAFSVDESVRQSIRADAVKVAAAVGYVNAGTVEFLVDNSGHYYFIEMNPRIQVEHTVSEMVTGIDLVQSQIYIAMGKKLSDPEIGITSQDDISLKGYSIQCRITTEDPANGFAPDTGKITTFRPGGGYGVRLDTGNAFPGAEISPYYDSLLAKLTTLDRTFEGAARKMKRAITEMRIRGVKTNAPFLLNILSDPMFINGKCHTKYIDETPSLFEFSDSKDRATKALKFIGSVTVANPASASKPTFPDPRVPEVGDEAPPTGLKQYLDANGPEAFSKWVLDRKELLICDTTYRDAHQSLLSTRVRTRDMLTVARATSHALSNCYSLEMWGGATFDVAYRFLFESPWERIDELRRRIPNIPFQMLFRASNAVGYSNYPDNVIKEFVKESAAAGIDIFRIFDSLNWLPGMELAMEEVAKSGKVVEAAMCYTGDILDPKREKYTLKYYVELAKELEKRGAHILAIKDMSGLIKPYAAKMLIKALKDEIGIPVHLHTHDTTANQIAGYLLATEAGVDIVDTAIASMSSLTSQPSMNSLVAALEYSDRKPDLDAAKLQKLSEYWSDIRPIYAQYEADLKTPETEIYRYEIPGGQYTNLKPQVESLELGDRFHEVKEKYREANDILGDIIKVTPSSKMVGDLAIFMTQNDLTAENIVQKAEALSFPDSVVSYFKGLMGQPEFGFPEDLRKVVLKGEEPLTDRPGKHLPLADFDDARKTLEKAIDNPTARDIVSYCLYPKVVSDFFAHEAEYGDLSRMASSVFFLGMAPGETTELTIEDGVTLLIQYIGPGDANADGTRVLHFLLNGAPRDIAVKDSSLTVTERVVRYADTDNLGHVGSSIPGSVSKVFVKKGDKVELNQPLMVIEAMKMETNVSARVAGTVTELLVEPGASVKAGELCMVIE